jgi:alpha-amylase
MEQEHGVMMQYFHWYTPNDGKLWSSIVEQASVLANTGFTSLWLPPAYKGYSGGFDTGYGVYDLYDLGEFDQKGTIRTKYGTREEYIKALEALKKAGITAYADIVLNHRMGADHSETVQATPYSREDRIHPKGETHEIKAYTHYSFEGRKKTYSDFEWHWYHFDAVDHDANHPDDNSTIYILEGKSFDDHVSLEFGNYDYLMGCDLDFEHDDVRKELTEWGKWYLETCPIDGFRLDAVKHIAAWFFPAWLEVMERHVGRNLFTVGEYWAPDVQSLHSYIEQTAGKISLLDVPLHYNFHKASLSGSSYDLSSIIKGTLMDERPELAVTFVANHDSQPLQALESVVEPWFKPLAYALILLRREGYPCVFFADYYGTEYTDIGSDGQEYHITMPDFKDLINFLTFARQRFTFGDQRDYFDHPNTIGWTFSGDAAHPGSLAVILSNGSEGMKTMETGKPKTDYIDGTGNVTTLIQTDATGKGEFLCNGGSISVWIEKTMAKNNPLW